MSSFCDVYVATAALCAANAALAREPPTACWASADGGSHRGREPGARTGRRSPHSVPGPNDRRASAAPTATHRRALPVPAARARSTACGPVRARETPSYRCDGRIRVRPDDVVATLRATALIYAVSRMLDGGVHRVLPGVAEGQASAERGRTWCRFRLRLWPRSAHPC